MRLCVFACLLSACAAGQPKDFDVATHVDDVQDRNPAPDVVEIALEASVTDVEILPGKPTTLWTYNGRLPGPVIRAKAGDRIKVHFHNALPEATTVHWHGVRVDNAMDGSGMVDDVVPPGGDYLYDFTARDAGTFWYHAHIASSRQVASGLYGALIVEDPQEPFFGDEVVLVLSDIQLRDDGGLDLNEASGDFGNLFGREGMRILVNGKLRPELRVRHGVPQRWRIINAARSRYFLLELQGQKFTQVGADGGLAPPQELDRIALVPGERADVVLVTHADGSERQFVMGLDARRFASELIRDPSPVLEVVYDGSATPVKLPAYSREVTPIDTTGAKERQIEFIQVGQAFGINGKRHPDGEVFMAAVGDREVWTIKNSTDFDHPFHLHGFFFQVLDAPVAWRDTVNVPFRRSIRVAIHFDERPGMWMYHCHILDHADNGMMGMVHLH